MNKLLYKLAVGVEKYVSRKLDEAKYFTELMEMHPRIRDKFRLYYCWGIVVGAFVYRSIQVIIEIWRQP